MKQDMEASEIEVKEEYIHAIQVPPSPVPEKAQPRRPLAEWEKDKIELAELKYAKDMIKNKNFPPYFDTQEGQQFLASNGMLPDMDKYTKQLAAETLHPSARTPSVASTTIPTPAPQGNTSSRVDMNA